MTDNKNDSWRVDKKMTLSLVFAVAIQAIATIWWAAGIHFQVNENTRRVAEIPQFQERVIRMETILQGLLTEVKAIRSAQKEILEKQYEDNAEFRNRLNKYQYNQKEEQ